MAYSLLSLALPQVGQIASLVIDEFIKLASAGYGETEFKRAKKQLQVGQPGFQNRVSPILNFMHVKSAFSLFHFHFNSYLEQEGKFSQ